jgi:hypothetical protein
MKDINHSEVELRALQPVVLVPRDEGISAVPRIRNFRVGTDSVVATARIDVSAATSRIEVDWGDGTLDVIRNRPGAVSLPAPGTNPLPEGSYRLQHVYEVSDDGRAVDYFVQVRTDDADGSFDFRQERITMTPRWRVVHYPMSVRLAENCDPLYNAGVTIKVVQTVDGQPVNSYTWNASNTFFSPSQFHLLENSGVSAEVEVAPLGQGADGRSVTFDFDEHDIFTPNDKNRIRLFLGWDARALEGDISERIERTNDGGCKIIYAFGREVSLLVPVDHVNPGVFAPPS